MRKILKSRREKSRKGELTTQQIVTIIIIIASFVILLYFLFRINPAETSSKQICYNSVVLMDKGSGLVGSLDCKTNYLCLSGGGSCADFSPTVTASVDPSKKEGVLKTIADEMSDCWWMFGEGKINYGTVEGTTIKYALCSIMEFDKKVQEKTPEISYSELYEYMKTHQSSHATSQSYLQYLYGVNDVSALIVQSQFYIIIAKDKIDTKQKYSIITGIDDNFGVGNVILPDEYLKVYIIPTAETSSKIVAGEFITKAA